MTDKHARYRGKGVYHVGPGGIEYPGDFGWRVDLTRECVDGVQHDRVAQVQFAQYCSKYGVCLIKMHQAPPDAASATWQWGGNWESPTITPSIGCDNAPRCGAHRTIVNGKAA